MLEKSLEGMKMREGMQVYKVDLLFQVVSLIWGADGLGFINFFIRL